MRAVVQRVSDASVTYQQYSAPQRKASIEESLCGSISRGIIVYLGIGIDDTAQDSDYLADKIAHLRIFMDSQEKMNLSILDLELGALVVSQFTLFADARKGRRPSYSQAAGPKLAEQLYQHFCHALRSLGVPTQTGKFQEIMHVRYTNDGPVTILLDSKKLF